jgi:hypothetical protein
MPATVKPPAAQWHYWVAFTSATGPGAVEITLDKPLTTGRQVANIQRELTASGIEAVIVLTWTLLRTDPAPTTDL